MSNQTIARIILATLYRPAFRARFGEELRGMIADTPVSAAALVNLAGGAARSWFTTGNYGTPAERTRLRDQRTVTSTWLAFFFIVAATVSTQMGIFDPWVLPSGHARAENLMGIGSDIGGSALVITVIGALVLLVLTVVSSVRRRTWRPIRAFLIGPALLVLTLSTAFVVSTVAGHPLGDGNPLGIILAGSISISFVITAIGAAVAIRLAQLSAAILRSAAYASIAVLLLALVSLAFTVAAVSVNGMAGWMIAPAPLIVLAIVIGLAALPGATRSALRLA